MISVNSMLTCSKPVHTPEEWAELNRLDAEYEAEQRRLKEREWLKYSQIPPIFWDAEIEKCTPSIIGWANQPDHDLIISGKIGRGKTYAACAALKTFCPERYCLFCQVTDVLEEIQATFTGHESVRDVIGKYANVGVLIIDDFGKSRPTAWMLENLFSIIDKRISRRKLTIYTTQYEGRELVQRLTIPEDRQTGLAIMSRLAAAEKVYLRGEDRRFG